MLESLILQNFQCHKRLKIDFSSTVTVLRGPNGAGKSAVLRALKWLTLNEWDGTKDTQIHWGESECSVKLKFDGISVTRSRTVSTNTYKLGGKEFRSFGVGIPEPIVKALKIERNNFQEQSDPAFWFYLSGGQVAQALNRIINLDSIDTSLTNVAQELRKALDNVQFTDQRHKEAANLTKSLSWTVEAMNDLMVINDNIEKSEEINARLAQVRTLWGRFKSATALRSKLVDAALGAAELKRQIDDLEQVNKRIDTLTSTLNKLTDKGDLACQLTDRLKQKESRLKKLLKTCPLCGRADPQ